MQPATAEDRRTKKKASAAKLAPAIVLS